MWDGGINNLEVQPLAPLTAPNEMAEDINNVVNKLSQDDQYKQLFKAAFGTEEVNSQRMLKALSQFMITLVSANSKYDKMKEVKQFSMRMNKRVMTCSKRNVQAAMLNPCSLIFLFATMVSQSILTCRIMVE
jgi:cytochrome c peroxidase